MDNIKQTNQVFSQNGDIWTIGNIANVKNNKILLI